MAVKEEKKKACLKVKIRRNALGGRSDVTFDSFPRLRTYVSQVPPVTSRPISPLSPTEGSDHSPSTPNHESADDTADHRGLSVDWVLDSPYSEVKKLLRRLDLKANSDLILETILHYSLVIRGLPDCPEEDLPLAVYFFLEDTFSIQSRLLKCVKICLHDGKMDVGVVFDSIRMKYDVLKKDELLEGTEVRIENNHTLSWFGRYPGDM